MIINLCIMSVLLAFEIFRSARFDRNHKLTCFLPNRVLIQALVAFSLSVDHPGRSAHRKDRGGGSADLLLPSPSLLSCESAACWMWVWHLPVCAAPLWTSSNSTRVLFSRYRDAVVPLSTSRSIRSRADFGNLLACRVCVQNKKRLLPPSVCHKTSSFSHTHRSLPVS